MRRLIARLLRRLFRLPVAHGCRITWANGDVRKYREGVGKSETRAYDNVPKLDCAGEWVPIKIDYYKIWCMDSTMPVKWE